MKGTRLPQHCGEREPDSSVERRAKAKAAAKGKPLRHQLIRKPTATRRARWEAVHQAKSRGPSLRAIAKEPGMSRVATRKYALAESPPTKLLSAQERAKAEARSWPNHRWPQTNPGGIFAFQRR